MRKTNWNSNYSGNFGSSSQFLKHQVYRIHITLGGSAKLPTCPTASNFRRVIPKCSKGKIITDYRCRRQKSQWWHLKIIDSFHPSMSQWDVIEGLRLSFMNKQLVPSKHVDQLFPHDNAHWKQGFRTKWATREASIKGIEVTSPVTSFQALGRAFRKMHSKICVNH